MDGALPPLHVGGGAGIWDHRRPHSPPDQGDHRTPEEAATLPVPTSAVPQGQSKGGRRDCVLRQGELGEIEPAWHDESLPARMVSRSGGLAQGALARAEPPTGHRPAYAGNLIPDYAASSAGFGRVQIRNTSVFAKG